MGVTLKFLLYRILVLCFNLDLFLQECVYTQTDGNKTNTVLNM